MMKKYTLIIIAFCLIGSLTQAEQKHNNSQEEESDTLLVGDLSLTNEVSESIYYETRTILNGKINGNSFRNTRVSQDGIIAPNASKPINGLLCGTWGKEIALYIALCRRSKTSENTIELTTSPVKFIITTLNGNYIIQRAADGRLLCIHKFISANGKEVAKQIPHEVSENPN